MRYGTSFVLIMAGLGAAACKDGEACTRARHDAANVYEEVMKAASRLKLQGAAGYEELSAEQKGEHYKIWEEIEKQTDMIFKSFAFEKITWNTAEPAKQKAEKAFDGYFDKAEYKGFQTSLEDAAKKFQAAEAACK